MNIINRQSVNIGIDLSVLTNNNINASLTLRFVPDEVIMRSITYSDRSTADTNAYVCQIYSDLIDDQILGLFFSGGNSTTNMEQHFKLRKRFQNGTINVQVQLLPTQGYTGIGPLVNLAGAVVNGNLSFILEFLKHSS
jgi:hypothetical protein